MVELSMTTFNVRSFIEQKQTERRRKIIFSCSMFAAAAIAVLCATWEMSGKSCERVVRWTGPWFALSCELEEEGTLDPDGPLSLRPTLELLPALKG